MLNRRSNFQQHPDFHITSSTILASTLHITRVNNRNLDPANQSSEPGPQGEPEPAMPENGTLVLPEMHQHTESLNSDDLAHSPGTEGQTGHRQEENGANPGAMNSFSSMLLWLLGGVYSESFNSILSIFRDGRVQGQVYAESPREDNPAVQGIQ